MAKIKGSSITKVCIGCQNQFLANVSEVKRNRALYCSLSCKNLHYSLSIQARKKISEDLKKQYANGRVNSLPIGEEHHAWKGDTVSYRNLHKWVERQLGKPEYCESCGIDNLEHRQYHWANISRQYKRILSDWIRLCVRCHRGYDLSENAVALSLHF